MVYFHQTKRSLNPLRMKTKLLLLITARFLACLTVSFSQTTKVDSTGRDFSTFFMQSGGVDGTHPDTTQPDPDAGSITPFFMLDIPMNDSAWNIYEAGSMRGTMHIIDYNLYYMYDSTFHSYGMSDVYVA